MEPASRIDWEGTGRLKAKELGYPHELWTTRRVASHGPTTGPRLGMIDLLTGKVHSLVKDRHRRREFVRC